MVRFTHNYFCFVFCLLVYRDTAGAVFHKELARELVEFALPIVEREGGTMSLMDIYCVFNRARGVGKRKDNALLDTFFIFPSLFICMAPYGLFTDYLLFSMTFFFFYIVIDRTHLPKGFTYCLSNVLRSQPAFAVTQIRQWTTRDSNAGAL